jgi:hypothetical protein
VGNREPVEREEATLMSERLKGNKVAIVVADMVERVELVAPAFNGKLMEEFAEGIHERRGAQVVEAR